MESGDFALAKVIIETAAIKVTKGSLSETFDEFGHKYQVERGLVLMEHIYINCSLVNNLQIMYICSIRIV